MAIEDRTKILLGPNYEKMEKIKVSIAGIGGVGSIVPLILARTGVKKFVLVDKNISIFKIFFYFCCIVYY